MFTFACQDHLPPGKTLAERLTNLRAYGFDAVELLGWGLQQRLPETRIALEASGLPVSAICAGFEGSLLHPEPAQRRIALDGIKRLLEVAEELHAGGLIIAPDYGTPALPDLRPAADPAALQHELLAAGLRELGEHLHGMRSALYLEPLNRYESRALRRTAPAVSLCKEVGSPNILVLYDAFHMAIEEADPVAALREAGPYLGYVHLADSNRQLPGHGHTDFAALLGVLREMDFTGAASLECGIPGDPADLLPKCAAYLRERAA